MGAASPIKHFYFSGGNHVKLSSVQEYQCNHIFKTEKSWQRCKVLNSVRSVSMWFAKLIEAKYNELEITLRAINA